MAAPKLSDIAKRAGVSIAAVSIALNRHKKGNTTHVSPGTRELIRKIATELGYSPNSVAKALAERRTYLLGLMVPMRDPIFFDPFIAQAVSGIQATLMRRRYNLLIYSPSRTRGCNRSDHALRSRFTDGLIFINTPFCSALDIDRTIRKLEATDIVFTMMNSYYGRASFNYVGIDDTALTEAAVRYLVERGHRRIAFLSGSAGLPTHIQMLEGWKRGFQQAGLQMRPGDVACSGYNRAHALHILDSWFGDWRERPTAVFTADESLLLYTYDYLQERHLRVPDDIAVITRANSASPGGLRPRPTAFLVPSFEMGELAADILIDSIEQPKKPRRHVLLPFKLAEGHTT